MAIVTNRVVRRPRAFLRVAGPDAADFLQRMVSNDVEALAASEACDALLLTPKARIVAPLRVVRRADNDFLLSTEPELGESVRTTLLRARFAAKCEVEPEQHDAWHVLGGAEVIDARPEGDEATEGEFERARIEAGIPRWGHELDERVLPAEAGLDETHISFTKGCFPGQEPIARQRYRGKVNRLLRSLRIDGNVAPGDPIRHGERDVGRITSAVDGIALGYVRTDVPEDAVLQVGAATARLH
jgi:folate-binding protein YgfZ